MNGNQRRAKTRKRHRKRMRRQVAWALKAVAAATLRAELADAILTGLGHH